MRRTARRLASPRIQAGLYHALSAFSPASLSDVTHRRCSFYLLIRGERGEVADPLSVMHARSPTVTHSCRFRRFSTFPRGIRAMSCDGSSLKYGRPGSVPVCERAEPFLPICRFCRNCSVSATSSRGVRDVRTLAARPRACIEAVYVASPTPRQFQISEISALVLATEPTCQQRGLRRARCPSPTGFRRSRSSPPCASIPPHLLLRPWLRPHQRHHPPGNRTPQRASPHSQRRPPRRQQCSCSQRRRRRADAASRTEKAASAFSSPTKGEAQ